VGGYVVWVGGGCVRMCVSVAASLCDAWLCAQRFEFALQQWRELTGSTHVDFSNATYLSERATANRNRALAHLLVRIPLS
jgi:glutaminase